MRALMDTNVILDFFLARNPHYENAKEIFSLVYKEEIDAYTTASSITDIYYIVAKRLGNDSAREVLKSLFNLVTVISINGEDCTLALNLPIVDYEDALVSICANKEDMDFIVTNDADFLSIDTSIVCVITPSRFLETIALE